MLHIGFTGTQEGMTQYQHKCLLNMLTQLQQEGAKIFHHGDCIGADAQAHTIALALGYEVQIHPPDNPTKRAYCKHAQVIYPKKSYMDRNQNIVDICDVLVATPASMIEEIRSGTWATIRRGKNRNKDMVRILYPRQLDF